MACLLGTSKDVPHSSGLSSIDVKVKSMWPPARHTSFERGGVRGPLWRTAFYSYLNGVWEWVQVTSDHVANHYTALAHAYATTKASSQTHSQVSSIAPPTECSLAVTLPSAQLSHKWGATTHPKGSIRNVKVHPGSSDPPSGWNTWEEYLQSKPGEFTPDQIVAVMAQNQLKIDRTMARILEMFNWYSTSRLAAVVGHFKH